jgi:hypothetical protein
MLMTKAKNEASDTEPAVVTDEQVADLIANRGRGRGTGEGVLVAWVGHPEDRSPIRRISSDDFMSVGVEHADVEFNTTTSLTSGQALVSERAAEYLLEHEQGFARVTEGEEAFAFRS